MNINNDKCWAPLYPAHCSCSQTVSPAQDVVVNSLSETVVTPWHTWNVRPVGWQLFNVVEWRRKKDLPPAIYRLLFGRSRRRLNCLSTSPCGLGGVGGGGLLRCRSAASREKLTENNSLIELLWAPLVCCLCGYKLNLYSKSGWAGRLRWASAQELQTLDILVFETQMNWRLGHVVPWSSRLCESILWVLVKVKETSLHPVHYRSWSTPTSTTWRLFTRSRPTKKPTCTPSPTAPTTTASPWTRTAGRRTAWRCRRANCNARDGETRRAPTCNIITGYDIEIWKEPCVEFSNVLWLWNQR